jgi:hypothetical protein
MTIKQYKTPYRQPPQSSNYDNIWIGSRENWHLSTLFIPLSTDFEKVKKFCNIFGNSAGSRVIEASGCLSNQVVWDSLIAKQITIVRGINSILKPERIKSLVGLCLGWKQSIKSDTTIFSDGCFPVEIACLDSIEELDTLYPGIKEEYTYCRDYEQFLNDRCIDRKLRAKEPVNWFFGTDIYRIDSDAFERDNSK